MAAPSCIFKPSGVWSTAPFNRHHHRPKSGQQRAEASRSHQLATSCPYLQQLRPFQTDGDSNLQKSAWVLKFLNKLQTTTTGNLLRQPDLSMPNFVPIDHPSKPINEQGRHHPFHPAPFVHGIRCHLHQTWAAATSEIQMATSAPSIEEPSAKNPAQPTDHGRIHRANQIQHPSH